MPESVQQFDHGIYAIDTQYVRPGLDASHLIIDGGRAAFVDTGAGTSVPHLLAALDRLKIGRDQVDYVLLTHVHLDHAGGAGLLMQALPTARTVVHPRGSRHMIDPSKLIAGSMAVYGEKKFRELYGEIAPIPEARVVTVSDGERLRLGSRELEFIHTPGHALHHYCIVDHTAQAVFSGDTFGLSYREFDSPRGEFIFPTTTPVQFDPAALHASIDRIMSYSPRAIYLTHYSQVKDLPRLAAALHADIDMFVDIAQRNADKPNRGECMRVQMFDYLLERLRGHSVHMSEQRIRDVIGFDVELNVQGLEVWLDRQS